MIPEHVGEALLAQFALKLSPVDAGVMRRLLGKLLGLEPLLEAEEVDELNASTANADLEEGVIGVIGVLPA